MLTEQFYEMWFNNKMKPHAVNFENNFIEGYYTQRMDIVDLINDLYESEDQAGKTMTGYVGTGKQKSDSYKESKELRLDYYPEIMAKWEQHILTPVLMAYVTKYPWALDVPAFTCHVEGTNIQEYNPGSKGYHRWHSERSNRATGHRHLVFMTYLNDVTDMGETEFWHQNVSVKPEAGLTLIFPSDWTYTHRGLGSPSQVKRFVTGWFSYQELSNE